MKITISGSMTFYKEMQELELRLDALGHEVRLPNGDAASVDFDSLSELESISVMKDLADDHIEKIRWADAVLVTNYDKGDNIDYIGTSTFMEMAQAYVLGKNIYLLNGVPEQGDKLEIQSMMPIVLNSDISLL